MALVNTIHHDGHGGVADDFQTDGHVAAWTHARWPAVAVDPAALRELRRAARAAFAAEVAPAPPSRADAAQLMPASAAARELTDAIAGLHLTLQARITDGHVRCHRTTNARGGSLVLGQVALAVTDFLTGPLAAKLRSCQAPRCVRYFLQGHGKQQWCKQSCGNRARVARHAAQHR